MAAHTHTHITTQSEHLYHTCIHVHVRTCTHVPVDSSLFSSSSSAPVLTEAVPLSTDISCFRPTTTTTYTHWDIQLRDKVTWKSCDLRVAMMQVPFTSCLYPIQHTHMHASKHRHTCTHTPRSHYPSTPLLPQLAHSTGSPLQGYTALLVLVSST